MDSTSPLFSALSCKVVHNSRTDSLCYQHVNISGPRVMRGSKSVTRLPSTKGGRKAAHDARFYGRDEVMNDQTEAPVSMAIGTWIGREQAFNALAHHSIVDSTIEFRGEQIPITPENTAKIKAAVSALRKDIERAEPDNLVRRRPNITSLQIRFDAYCEDIRRLIHHAKFEENKPAVRVLLLQSCDRQEAMPEPTLQ
jgi:hypothetical protein